MNPIIEFNNVTFQYHSQAEPTLKDINVAIYPGEKILVIGPSGSGKSTFAHCINGLIPHIYSGNIQGNVLINGKQVLKENIADLSFDVGTVLQDTDGQFVGLTVAEDIAFSLENENVEQSVMKQKVNQFADIVGLSHHLSHRPQDLSGGQKQRVSMAGVLIDEVPVLLLDEPLANLDPESGQYAITLVDDICRSNQTTAVIIEHRLEDVLHRPIDRIIVFDDGTIVSDTTPEKLLKSDLLEKIGIREPLYVTAMKYAKINMADAQHLEDLNKVNSPDLKEKMTQWHESIPEQPFIKKEDTLLSLKHIDFQYTKHGKQVLNDLSLDIHKGEIFSIVGKNGSGKSTLCKSICGFVTPQQGAMTWKGQDFTTFSIKERADNIGFVMQNPNQMISKKMIREEVGLGLVLRGVSEEKINKKVDETLKVCGLYPFRNWPISALSYGQKKRVTIASILVLEPELILLDEPTAGQDLRHYTEMMQFLKKLNKQGLTIGMVTHDMHLMLEYAERTIVIDEGAVVADTSPVDVLTDHDIVKQASLKETSLFLFAEKIGLKEPVTFVNKFIAYDKEARLQ
ncbi:ABC transporter ATP-binding protein [Vagococcus elongatus]|uniref:Heme ABC transporter ATP-binding protein n=1 Tax=Vagococcus elongatus TaxID=180344 RepID=A0A430B642_9ENTE|nr:ABC transporter ATP-binding protein [Vagococcus elongatus]RSU15757.1 heme ABC transporter ATP-binding protein [Vagococcus elongatus]